MNAIKWEEGYGDYSQHWRGQIKGSTSFPYVEMKRQITGPTVIANVTVVVSLGDGYNFGQSFKVGNTKGANVHVACNGPIQWTFEEFDFLNRAVAEAKEALEGM